MCRVVVAALVVAFFCSQSLCAATPQEVDTAIAKAVKYLYAKQKDGNWERVQKRNPTTKPQDRTGGQWGGETALVTYALLAAGESPQNPRLAKSIDFLKGAELVGTYALALRAQVYQLLPMTPQLRGLVVKDANTLRGFVKTRGEAVGMFDYVDSPGNGYSHSRANYGALGMWALDQAGVEVPGEFWDLVEKGWMDHQDPATGGWSYIKTPSEKHPVTAGMTAAGLASLYITQDYVNPNRGLNCVPSPSSPAIDKGLNWLEANFSKVAADEDYYRDFPYPTLYAIERVGVASGLKYFGKIDWYQRGADWLIKEQVKNGSFSESGKGGSITDTAFALLFLARGRSPIIVNKLDYASGAADAKTLHWDTRPRDAARMVRWVGKSVERDLNWQIVNLTAPADELSDAPILYIAGKDEWKPSDDGAAKIKQFIESGGLVLANADCMGRPFVASIRKLGSEMFPGYEFRELPENHPIYTEEQFRRDKWKNKPSVLGLSNDVRELMLIIPQADPAKSWQAGMVGGREEHWQLAANIVLYAVDKRGLRARGETHLVTRDAKVKPSKTIELARLEYPGNWNPEPGGWRRMSDVMFNQGFALKVSATKSADEIGKSKIIHLTGTLPVTLDPAVQAALKRAIDNGGTLIVDAAGGASEFAASVEKLFPLIAKEPLKPIPPDHALFAAGGGPKLTEVGYREYARRTVGSTREPRLQGVERNGRMIIIYSREDLSAGLVGHAVDGIVGYDPASATALMSHILSYAAAAKK
jgi:hypothetical protein